MVLKYQDYTNIDCLKPFPSQQKQMQAENKEGFYLAKNVDIHAIRRAQMLAKYPQILDLYGTNIWVGIGVTVTTICQIALAATVCDASWPVFLFCAYVFTATGMASVQLGLHEICHNAASPHDWLNRLFELILNLPLLIPFAATYKVFHLDHHRYQGVDQVDTDLPTESEAKFWCNKSYPYPLQCLMKCGFLATNLAAYGLRPVSQRPENVVKVRLTVPYILNHVCQVLFTYAMYHFFGINSVLYLLTGLLLSGIHPTAGHFLAEHYPFENTLEKYQLDAPIETYSYYGIFNYVLYNGGYHIEHHDFLKIPFHNLPKLRQIAPEFYPPEMEVKSYTGAPPISCTSPCARSSVSTRRRSRRTSRASCTPTPASPPSRCAS